MSEIIELKSSPLSLRAELVNFNTEFERKKVINALNLMLLCVNSDEFHEFVTDTRNRVMRAEYHVGWWLWKKKKVLLSNLFKETNKSDMDIMSSIYSAKEVLSSDIDNEIDLDMVIDRSWSFSTIGYTYADSEEQYIYDDFFYNAELWEISGNIFHEWTHKLGFKHQYKYYVGREFTVPYALGYFVRDWVKTYVNTYGFKA